ncbi:MAG: exosome complex protein Rrp42 [Candidatus Aenigmatarchaeota archaeon]
MKNKDSYVRKMISEGNRPDGREFEQFRHVKVEHGVIKTAEGSARVQMGGTLVVAGVKMEMHEPYPDSPNEGTLMVDAELVPLASPDFEPGPPSEAAVELARVVDRGIRESHSIDMAKLCITPGELVWTVHIDIHILNHDGNLIDAASLAAMAALLDTKVPAVDMEKKTIIRERGDAKGEMLPVTDKPIEVTTWKMGTKLFLDPNMDEDEEADARVTIATTEAGDLCAMQKGGTGWFSTSELLTAADLAIAKGKELRKLLHRH